MTESRLSRLFGAAGPEGRGLELGALHAPLLRKPEHDVLYVDYAPTEVVRANQFDPAINPADIVEVDVVWGAVPLRQAVGHTVDFVVASHVIEHVPDLIGWFAELHEVLRPGGVLALVVPDKRFTFDALRKDSTLAEAVEAYLLGYRQPSLRQVFDVASLGVPVEPAVVWNGDFAPASTRPAVLSRLAKALELARSLKERPRYQDAHCWVFTPSSFIDLMEELANLDLLPFRIEAFHATGRGDMEFFVRLIALPDRETAESKPSVSKARQALVDAPAPTQSSGGELLEENRRLRAELVAMRTSTSWRLTAPLRALKRSLAAGR